MAKNNYDPFTMRKKIPDFPSVFGGEPGNAGGFKPVQPGWEMPFQHTKGKMDTGVVPDFPADAGAQNAWGGTPIPEFPTVNGGWQKLMPGSGGARGPVGGDADGDGIPDTQFAGDMMKELDDILNSINGYGSEQPEAPEVYDDTDPSKMTPVGAQPPDRSWMFQKRDGWDGPQTQSRNYTPAPVTFNQTRSADWGNTALDQRAGRTGPAATTVRYYDRAMARAEGGSKADQNRVARLRLRIQGRPTNG